MGRFKHAGNRFEIEVAGVVVAREVITVVTLEQVRVVGLRDFPALGSAPDHVAGLVPHRHPHDLFRCRSHFSGELHGRVKAAALKTEHIRRVRVTGLREKTDSRQLCRQLLDGV